MTRKRKCINLKRRQRTFKIGKIFRDTLMTLTCNILVDLRLKSREHWSTARECIRTRVFQVKRTINTSAKLRNSPDSLTRRQKWSETQTSQSRVWKNLATQSLSSQKHQTRRKLNWCSVNQQRIKRITSTSRTNCKLFRSLKQTPFQCITRLIRTGWWGF